MGNEGICGSVSNNWTKRSKVSTPAAKGEPMFNPKKHYRLSEAVISEYQPDILREIKRLPRNPYAYYDIQSALVAAAANDMADVGRMLIEMGADVNYGVSKVFPIEPRYSTGEPPVSEIPDRYGYYASGYERPPIFNAVETASFRVAELLVHRGADLNTFDKKGTTPLHRFHWSVLGKVDARLARDLYDLLIRGGADADFGGQQSFNRWLDEHRCEHEYPFAPLGSSGAARKSSPPAEAPQRAPEYRIVERDRLFGIADETGKEIVPVRFDWAYCDKNVEYAVCLYISRAENRAVIFIKDLQSLNAKAMYDIGDYYHSYPDGYWYYDRERRALLKLDIDRSGRYKLGEPVSRSDYTRG